MSTLDLLSVHPATENQTEDMQIDCTAEAPECIDCYLLVTVIAGV